MRKNRGSRSGDEFSPWPSYVDIFSATIMVLLLFMLVLFTLIAHYAEAASKLKNLRVSSSGDEELTYVTKKEYQRLQNLVIKELLTPSNQVQDANQSTALKGEPSDGGALRRDEQNQTQEMEFNKDEMEIVFKSMDVFVTRQFLDEIAAATKSMLRKQPNAKVYITVGDPKSIISSTMAKQISLGRVLNIKNKLNRVQELEGKISIAISQKVESKYDFGHLKIEVGK